MTDAELKRKWPELNRRRCALIDRDITNRDLNPDEQKELDELQDLADRIIDMDGTLKASIQALEAMRKEMGV